MAKRNDELISRVGKNIKKYREHKKISIEKLAVLANVEAKSLYNWEHGLVSPSITSLDILASHLDINITQFFE